MFVVSLEDASTLLLPGQSWCACAGPLPLPCALGSLELCVLLAVSTVLQVRVVLPDAVVTGCC